MVRNRIKISGSFKGKRCTRRLSVKERRDVRTWAKTHGAKFTVKEYNSMLRRVLKSC